MPTNTYQDTLDFLYAQLPMYHRVGASAYKKDLTNTLTLCEALGQPQHQFKSIHVGGTNGKGSVSHLLAAACQAAGLKTGLYVSPHYKDFRERIRVNGQYIPKQKVVEFVEKTRTLIASVEPSFFELCVAMAFDYFAEEKVDIAIIEVGLGGRLDSTNVITPLLSVITNISYDHMNMLGNTLALIAGEKAGIIKPEVPVVIGETHPESAPVFVEMATRLRAPIQFADQVCTTDTTGSLEGHQVRYRVQHQVLDNQPHMLVSDAIGPFQRHNINTAVVAIRTLDALSILPPLWPHVEVAWRDIRHTVRYQGRWQILGQQPLILADSAHNEGGLRVAFDYIQQNITFENLHIITGFVNDKDIHSVLPLFPKNAHYYFAKANIPRGLPADELRAFSSQYQLNGRAYKTVKNALAAAKRSASSDDLIVIIGSIFVVAEVL
jgi:dihydrofolate synthase / folylpolyglutamate synthase